MCRTRYRRRGWLLRVRVQRLLQLLTVIPSFPSRRGFTVGQSCSKTPGCYTQSGCRGTARQVASHERDLLSSTVCKFLLRTQQPVAFKNPVILVHDGTINLTLRQHLRTLWMQELLLQLNMCNAPNFNQIMGETIVWMNLKSFLFLQLRLLFVRAAAAPRLSYPAGTPVINLPNLDASASATHACLVHGDSKVFSQAVSTSLQRHPSSKRTLWHLCITVQLKARGQHGEQRDSSWGTMSSL